MANDPKPAPIEDCDDFLLLALGGFEDGCCLAGNVTAGQFREHVRRITRERDDLQAEVARLKRGIRWLGEDMGAGYCERHPEIDPLRAWGCPDCLTAALAEAKRLREQAAKEHAE